MAVAKGGELGEERGSVSHMNVSMIVGEQSDPRGCGRGLQGVCVHFYPATFQSRCP